MTVKGGDTVIVSEYKYCIEYLGRRSISQNFLRRPYSTLTLLSMRRLIMRKYVEVNVDL